ncbi:hypothetical protein E6B08_10280 [Pseudomonas putida]|uniref:Uncharacterized protein n=1 Tax=Pseudomonas putida TaxID=303 RepID=A0A4D6X6S8_PSEPU|nr:hypothetical protein E6B08_10280 [Pseudomonas putida]
MCIALAPKGAAVQPNRDTRPLPQGNAISCGSGLVSRLGRKAPPPPRRQKKAPDQAGAHRQPTNQPANRLSNTWHALPSERFSVPQGCRRTWVLMPM